MKIVIPVLDNSMESNVCVSFGRTPYFLIYDTEAQDSTFIKNTAANSQGGAGIKAAQIIADNKVDVVLTPRCGENAAEVLKTAGIKIYKTINDSLQDNLNAFGKGELDMLTETHAGFHGRGQ